MITIYEALRQEILMSDQLLHWFTFIVLVLLMAGLAVCEIRTSIASVVLPMLSLTWAASVVRFDVFIHRAGAYLQSIEGPMLNGAGAMGWEQWKSFHRPGVTLIASADVVVFAVIIALTLMMLQGPTRDYFKHRQWPGINLFIYVIVLGIMGLLATIAIIPRLTSG